MSKEKLSRKEVSQLNYYDFTAYLGVPLFQFSGLKVAEDLIRRCGIHSGSEVLEVGCGTGFMACRISEEKNCRIVGIDISNRMIEMARERAEKLSLENKATFRVADAKKLPFEDNSFDVVFSQFVCVLLDKKRALHGYTDFGVPFLFSESERGHNMNKRFPCRGAPPCRRGASLFTKPSDKAVINF